MCMTLCCLLLSACSVYSTVATIRPCASHCASLRASRPVWTGPQPTQDLKETKMQPGMKGKGTHGRRKTRLSHQTMPHWSFECGVCISTAHSHTNMNWPWHESVLGLEHEGPAKTPLLPGGHVTAGNLPDATSFGCVSFVVGYFPDFFCPTVAVWQPQVLLWLGIFWLWGVAKNIVDKSSCSIP